MLERDMELIRRVLLEVKSGNLKGPIDGYTDEQVRYNKYLAIEKGLLTGSHRFSLADTNGIPSAVITRGITWEGHDFLEAIADESRWNQTKSFLKETGKVLTIDTALWAVKQLFGINS